MNPADSPHFPRLWCPPLTHYKADGGIDTERIAAHWRFMQPYVNAFLVPGSTGDAWEMSDDEINRVLALSLELAQKLDSQLLLGALKSDAATTRVCIEQMLEQLKTFSGTQNPLQAMQAARVRGFVICPPAGQEITEREMENALRSVLETGLPIAVYQLPQITQNEMNAELINRLSDDYPGLQLLKDSSGEDKVARAVHATSRLFLVRGAEGDYANWLQETGGPYHGLLLSTANSFPEPLRRMIDLLEAGKNEEAQKVSDQLSSAVTQVFELVASVPDGNAFANANKAIDHFMAYGPEPNSPPPRLHAGSRLPEEIIERVAGILKKSELLPSRGYMNGN